jgi:hypothetical protein
MTTLRSIAPGKFPLTLTSLVFVTLLLSRPSANLVNDSHMPGYQHSFSTSSANQFPDNPSSPEDPKGSKEASFTPISDLEWSSLSAVCQRVALLVWERRESVPAGFLTDPKYKDQYEYAAKIYSRVSSKQEGGVSAANSDDVLVNGILVKKSLLQRADYVVEDPSNKGVAMYLDAVAYQKLQSSCVSVRKELRTLYHPGSDKTKFPPRIISSISTRWLTRQKRHVFPLISTDVYSWAAFVHPSIATLADLKAAKPKDSAKCPLSPTQKITDATPYLVRCFSIMQSVIFLHQFSSQIAWCVISMVLYFHHTWYYTSLRHSCKVFKEAKRLVFKYLAGTPEHISIGVVVSIDPRGLPKLIPLYLRLLIVAGDKMAIAAALFALDVSRMYVYAGPDSTSSITGEPSVSSGEVSMFAQWIPIISNCMVVPEVKKNNYSGSFVNEDKSEYVTILGLVKYFFTNKVGPNGHALLSAVFDSVALVRDPVLFGLFSSYCEIINNTNLPIIVRRMSAVTESVIASVSNMFDVFIPNFRNGKIGRVYTANGKVRLVAIPSYFIQIIFKPLHLFIFRILKTLPTDCTFDQEAGVKRISDIGGEELRSYDLSSATDRLPLSVQIPVVVLLACWCGFDSLAARRLALTWASIIRSIDFTLLPRVKTHKEKTLRYRCGHPMGTYSSWAVFTLTHHFIVQICAYFALLGYKPGSGQYPALPSLYYKSDDKKKGSWLSNLSRSFAITQTATANPLFTSKGWYLRYQLLGDDIVLFCGTTFEREVAEWYFYLCNLIGVKINPAKGFSSKNGSFEFAKRFVRSGVHLNTIYWGEWNVSLNPFDITSRIRKMLDRGYKLVTPRLLLNAVISMLPIQYSSKRELMYLSFQPISLLCSNRRSGLQPFLPAFALASFLMLYECSVQLWVRMSMGAHPISYESTLPLTPRPSGIYKNILSLVDRVGVLLVETSTKTFRFRMNLPTIFTNHFVSILVPKFASVGFDSRAEKMWGDSSLSFLSVHDRTREYVFHYLLLSVQFLVLFLMSPVTQIMSFLKLYSNNIMFAEAESMKKYKKSIELDPDAPLDILERVKSNDYTIKQQEDHPSDAASSLRVMRVLGAFLYAYELVHNVFCVTVTDESIFDPIASEIEELKAPILSAAARILIWLDGVTFDRHRLKPEWLLPTVLDANLISFYGSTMLKKEVKVNVKTPVARKPKRGAPITRSVVVSKFYEVLGVGPFSPGYRTVPREDIHSMFVDLNYKKIENTVCKTIMSDGSSPFVTRLSVRL